MSICEPEKRLLARYITGFLTLILGLVSGFLMFLVFYAFFRPLLYYIVNYTLTPLPTLVFIAALLVSAELYGPVVRDFFLSPYEYLLPKLLGENRMKQIRAKFQWTSRFQNRPDDPKTSLWLAIIAELAGVALAASLF